MTNGPIERYKEAQALNRAKREAALGEGGPKRHLSKNRRLSKKGKKKNPYLSGTPNYHRWEDKNGKKK